MHVIEETFLQDFEEMFLWLCSSDRIDFVISITRVYSVIESMEV